MRLISHFLLLDDGAFGLEFAKLFFINANKLCFINANNT